MRKKIQTDIKDASTYGDTRKLRRENCFNFNINKR